MLLFISYFFHHTFMGLSENAISSMYPNNLIRSEWSMRMTSFDFSDGTSLFMCACVFVCDCMCAEGWGRGRFVTISLFLLRIFIRVDSKVSNEVCNRLFASCTAFLLILHWGRWKDERSDYIMYMYNCTIYNSSSTPFIKYICYHWNEAHDIAKTWILWASIRLITMYGFLYLWFVSLLQ